MYLLPTQGTKGNKQQKKNLFLPIGPLDHIAIDLIGPLPKTKNKQQFISVITDRYSRLTIAVPM